MRYAEVAVDAPAGRSTYSYVVPAGLDVRPGSLVRVPFGSRTARGVVVELSSLPVHEATRAILAVEDGYRLAPEQLDIGAFVSRTYLSPPFPALALFFPPGLAPEPRVSFHPAPVADSVLPELSPDEQEMLRAVQEQGTLKLEQLRRGPRAAARIRALTSLLERGLVQRSEEARRRPVAARTAKRASLRIDAGEAGAVAESLARKGAGRQACILLRLLSAGSPVPVSDLRLECGATAATIAALEARGLVDISEERIWRDTVASRSVEPSVAPPLTPSQAAAWERMERHWGEGNPPEFLLFGVTGSGKTELYLRAARRTVESGRQVLCLVPEIALAAQTVERFASRFPGRVSVVHSGLTPGQAFDEWDRIQHGTSDIVVGARSALFAPLARPGLIILDEEQDWAYKQDDTAPRYHARTVAREMASRYGAVLMLGSATPDVETFHRSAASLAHLLELPSRVAGSAGLPPVEVVDMREELKSGNAGMFSSALGGGMAEALGRHEQVLLLLNRRGTATMVQCRRCAHVISCPRCSVALAHHAGRGRLVCHRCGYTAPMPGRCPACRSDRLRYLGVGTQGVVDEIGRLSPGAHVVRWDSDVPARVRGGSGLSDAVRSGEVDVIVGTQMVGKGLDFPGVTLVGVVNADVGLNVPDFRSGERIFQLLCQAAGRAGRGMQPGKVVVQSYAPEHYVIRSAASHDYRSFYADEMRYRAEAGYPPFGSIAQMVYAHADERRCRLESERVRAVLEARIRGTDLRLTGPAPAFVWRLRGRYRMQLTIRGSRPADVLADLSLPPGWVVDVEPAGIA